jgi:uncharacterized membrane protein
MMKTKFLTSAAIALATIGLLASHKNANAAEIEKEKCYGVAKAGANDCGSSLAGHSCAGQSKVSNSAEDYVLVPKGLCVRLVNGYLKNNEINKDEPPKIAPKL